MPEPTATTAQAPPPSNIEFIRSFMATLPSDTQYTATVIEALGGEANRTQIRARLDDFITTLRQEAYSPDTARLTIIVLYDEVQR